MNCKEHQNATLRRISLWSLIVSLGISIMALIGWFISAILLTSIRQQYIPMAPSTALCFSLLSSAFLGYVHHHHNSTWQKIASLCAFIVLLISSLLLLGFLLGSTFEAEHLGFNPSRNVGGIPTAHMSPLTALLFIAASVAMLLQVIPAIGKQLQNSASFFASSVTLTGAIMLVGYLYGTPFMYGGNITPVAITTAFSFVFLGLGMVTACGLHTWPVRYFIGPSMRSRLIRTFLPILVAVSFITELIEQTLPVTNTALLSSLVTILSAITITVIITKIAKSVGNEIDNANSERDANSKALQESELRYKKLFESNSDAAMVFDAETHKFEDVNTVALNLYGYAHAEFLALRVEDISSEPDKTSAMVAKVIAGNVDTLIPNRYQKKKDGTVFPVEIAIGTYLASNKKKIIGTVRDITERKQAEERLIESEKRLKREQALSNAIIDSIPGTFYMLDESGRYARWNTYQRDEIVGKPDELMTATNAADTIHPDDRALIGDRIANVLENGIVETVEGRVLLRGGPAFRWLLMTGRQMKIDGRPFLVGIGIDITEHKRMEEEKQSLQERLQRAEKMESLGLLAGGVAHDLNNVLGIIVGYSELILDSVDESSPLKSHLVNIMNGGQKAAAIVDDLLTLARRGVSGKEVLNLNKIIADCRQSPEFEKLSSYHPSVKINTDLEPDLPNITCSPVHLGKSLYNLVSNACEAMPKGGIVTIKTTSQYLDKPTQGYDHIRQGDYVVLDLSDTGDGINEADLKRIFEPFYTKKVMGRSGTGLGLAVVWGTVKDHHGYINVQSEEGKGSTFTLYFPVTREDITTEAVAASASEYIGKGESIIVVDDVKEQRDLAASLLSKLNYNVSSVSSGEEAVAYLKEHEVDLMVLDMIMDPGMDGLDTYKKILEIRPNQKAIIVSGFSESDRVKTAEGLGVGAYLKKPYIKEKLGLAVRRELDRVA